MKQPKKKRRSVFPFILLIILISSVGLLIYLVAKEAKNELAIIDMEKNTLKDFVIHMPENETEDYVFDWNGLKAINDDVVGWIRFDEPSRINYPIVQGETNQAYLKHNWQGQYQSAGAIFLSSHNSPDFTDMNSILYGHRMINGSMFGSLKKYASQEFMNTYPYFYIYTPDGKKRTYEIFTYAQVQDGSSTYEIQFKTAAERNEYYKTLASHVITKRDVELDEFDTTMVLSTCASRGYYERMVLLGKLVKIEVEKQP